MNHRAVALSSLRVHLHHRLRCLSTEPLPTLPRRQFALMVRLLIRDRMAGTPTCRRTHPASLPMLSAPLPFHSHVLLPAGSLWLTLLVSSFSPAPERQSARPPLSLLCGNFD